MSNLDHILIVCCLIFLPLPMAVGVAVSRAEVLVSTWTTREAPEPASKPDYLDPLVVTGGENSGLSGLKAT